MDNSTQKRILMAGKAEFLAKGFENASLRLIAKNAGVTTGAIYGYFSDKAGIYPYSRPSMLMRINIKSSICIATPMIICFGQ